MHQDVLAAVMGPLATLAQRVTELGNELVASLPRLGAALLALLATLVLAKLTARSVKRILEQADKRPSLVRLARQLSTIGVWIVGATVAATIAFPSLTPGQLVGVVGLGSVAVGFAFKDIFENFFAGILILWRFPFEMGDVIECNDIEGRVEDVTVRMTLIRAMDGQLLLVPNSILFKNAVTIRTAQPKRRARVKCGVAYDTELPRARDVIQTAVAGCPTVDGDSPIQVFADEFAESSIDFDIRWWTSSTPSEFRASQGEVIMAIKSALDDAGIEIPFPQRTLTFPEPLPLLETKFTRERSASTN